MDRYPCEVLIVGGGVLGLWVLHELHQRRTAPPLLRYASPILLEQGDLGCKQTCHSHAFLHQGFAYYDKKGVETFFDSWARWQQWLLSVSPTPPSPAPTAYHAFLDQQAHANAVAWRQNCTVPPPGTHNLNATHPRIGLRHDAIRTDEQCRAADWIVNHLSWKKDPHICRVVSVDEIRLSKDPTGPGLRVRAVRATWPDGRTGEFRPNTLLLCAGEQNRNLLNGLVHTVPPGLPLPPVFAQLPNLHRTVDMDMLVARDAQRSLPEYNGSVVGHVVRDSSGQPWSVQVFLVSRRCARTNAGVWVFSGEAKRIGSDGQKIVHKSGPPARRFLIECLKDVFEAFRTNYQQFEWGVYTARLTTLESNFPQRTQNPQKPQFQLGKDKFSNLGVEGLLVCFTDRLSIAPLAAEEIVQKVDTLKTRWPTPYVPMPPNLPSQPVPISPEYWREPQLWEGGKGRDWTTFEQDCL